MTAAGIGNLVGLFFRRLLAAAGSCRRVGGVQLERPEPVSVFCV
jgi:hypothetical protein